MTWNYPLVSENLIETKAREWNVSKFLATLLLKKGFIEKKDINDFLKPEINQFNNPLDFEMMDEVINKIISTKEKNEKIFVFGDYDIDGITATVFLVLALREIGINVDYFIPNRTDEGYGLNKKVINYINSKDGKLIITVDTSINSDEDIKYSKSLGIDIIITDHHKEVETESQEKLLTINPKFSKNYKFKFLSGAGVALKVVQALYDKLEENNQKFYQYLDLVMIGTVADVVSISGENRIITKLGLEVLENTKIKGLFYLKKYLKLSNKKISTLDISYFVSPLINSLGRMGNSKLGADFFLETDDFKIYNIIEEMKKSNRQRRILEKEMYDEIDEYIQNKIKNNEILKYVYVSSKKWNSGIIGVVSSRLSTKYNIPVVIISIKDKLAKASCRSVQGVSVFNILQNIQDKLLRFGGHDLAAGFIINEEDIVTVNKYFEKSINETVNKEEKVTNIDVSLELSLENINDKILNELQEISPFGIGNEYPYFIEKKVKLKEYNYFGIENKHFSATVEKNGRVFSIIGFQLSDKLSTDEDVFYDLIYYPERTNRMNDTGYQIRLKDLRLHRV